MGRAGWFAVLLTNMACGSYDVGQPAPSPQCRAPNGAYEAVLSLRSGTCGKQATMVVDLSEGAPAIGVVGDDCSVAATASTDLCQYETEQTCPVEPTQQERVQLMFHGGDLPATAWTTATTWNRDGTLGTGVWRLRQISPVSGCSSSYDAELRQVSSTAN